MGMQNGEQKNRKRQIDREIAELERRNSSERVRLYFLPRTELDPGNQSSNGLKKEYSQTSCK